jgi:hypothetical protein
MFTAIFRGNSSTINLGKKGPGAYDEEKAIVLKCALQEGHRSLRRYLDLMEKRMLKGRLQGKVLRRVEGISPALCSPVSHNETSFRID